MKQIARLFALALACLVAFTACSHGEIEETDSAPPPAAEESPNGLALTIDPPDPGSGATVSVRVTAPEGVEVSYRADVLLERREGEEWIKTHVLVATEAGGESFPVGESATVPAVAYTDGDPRDYALPELAAGQYRISREVAVSADTSTLAESLMVEFSLEE